MRLILPEFKDCSMTHFFYLIFGNSFRAVLLLVRNVLLANLLSVEHFGLATLIGVTVSLVELSTNLGLDRYAARSGSSLSAGSLRSLHLLSVARGAVGGFLLLVSADLIAGFYGAPELSDTIRLLAVVPMLNGFVHLQPFVKQADFKFRETAALEVVPPLVSCVLVLPLYSYVDTYELMLLLAATDSVVKVVVSHFVSSFRYSLGFGEEIYTILRFGLPLVPSSFFLFVLMQGDRIAISHFSGAEVVGVFASVSLLLLWPGMLVSKICDTVSLPFYTKALGSRHELEPDWACLLLATGFGGFMLMFIEPVHSFLYGARYEVGGLVVVYLTVAASLRIARSGSSALLIAVGFTNGLLYQNLLRVLFFVIAVTVYASSDSLNWFLCVLALGELAACVFTNAIAFHLTGGHRHYLVITPLLVLWAVATTFLASGGALEEAMLVSLLITVIAAIVLCRRLMLAGGFPVRVSVK